ncbi:hypothetical protein NUU61_005928 [Penicillium alfredii]|uniref:Uncharacterized protein n=1 Tax=Penicillium alfredii TaxID=1506179 RepID=A0A9W9EZX0_9EURO|nr:uncharacterized protein NUU61_005928 [Penicillium alfredii]KAJ5091058.1 hypothetical protein NUU61_005928 [Penicillium alfredii]
MVSNLSIISHPVAVTLPEVKWLLDLTSLNQWAPALNAEVPREILDMIQPLVPQSSIIGARGDVIDGPARQAKTERLKTQVNVLYTTIQQANQDFWSALASPARHLAARPSASSAGSVEETQLTLMWNYQSWGETPGAMEFIKAQSTK